MHALRKAATLVAVVGLGLSGIGTANAAGTQYFLDHSNESGVFADGIPYLKVSISDGAAGAIDFLVETLSPLSSIADSNYGIQSFSFNFGSTGATAGNIVLPSGWSIQGGNSSQSIFGKFDVTLKGTGSSRLDPLAFSITGVAGDSPADYAAELSSQGKSSLFAAHVAGFAIEYDNGEYARQISSAKFGGSSVVPLPASVWLMLSGLGYLFAWGRRQRKA